MAELEVEVQQAHDAAKRMMRLESKDGVKVYTHPLKFKVSDMAQEIFDAIRDFAEVNMAAILASDDRPLVYWQARDRETVSEEDLIGNFHLVKEYILVTGHVTPLPHLLHHEAAFILLSVTYNLHSSVYNVRGGRGLIRDWARTQATRLRCMGTKLMAITRATPHSREPQIRVLKNLVLKLHDKHGNTLSKKSSSASLSSSQEPNVEADEDCEELAQLEKVGSAEKTFLGSPREDRISVKRVLEFRDDIEDAMQVAQTSKRQTLAFQLGLGDDADDQQDPPAPCKSIEKESNGDHPARGSLIPNASDLPQFLKPTPKSMVCPSPAADGSLSCQQALLRKQKEEEKGEKAAEKVERKRRKKEATKDSPKESQGKGRGRGRGRGKGCGKGRKRKEPDEEEGVHIQKISGKGKGKGKRKVTKKPSKLISDCGETPVKRTRRTWKPSPMAVKTSKVASAADERLNKAKAALEELISRMEKGGNPYAYAFEPPPKGFLKKSYTIKPAAAHGDLALTTIGVVLYSRSFYINHAVEDKWPQSALQAGLKVNAKGGCTVPWGDDPMNAWKISCEIATWPTEKESSPA